MFTQRWGTRVNVAGETPPSPRGYPLFVPPDFSASLASLRRDIVAQGTRVFNLVLSAVESYFDLDKAKAGEAVKGDELVDKVDVEIERSSIPLLAMGVTDEHSI